MEIDTDIRRIQSGDRFRLRSRIPNEENNRNSVRGAVTAGGLVLMRRWVARWLFNEITRAISPADEVADRTRLLGIGIVELASFAVDQPLTGT